MNEVKPEFRFYMSQGKLLEPAEPELQAYDENSIDLEKIIQEQAYKIGNLPLWLLVFEEFRVRWAYVTGEGIQFESGENFSPDYLQELRLFGSHGEFYLWRGKNRFQSRLRLDYVSSPNLPLSADEMKGFPEPASELPNFADEWQALWGTSIQSQNREGANWLEIYEQRGVRMTLPNRLESQNGESKLPLRLRVRLYINYDPASGLGYYSDLRMVELRDLNFQPLAWL